MPITSFEYDRRNGKRRSRLKVIVGEIMGKVKKKKAKDSTFEIRTSTTALSIRGTDLRVGASTKVSRVALLEGHAGVSETRCGHCYDSACEYGK